MIDAIPSVAPQQASVEASSDPGKQSASSDSSFTAVLSAAVSGDQAKPAQAESQKNDHKQSEDKSGVDASADTAAAAGAIQMAMAVPVQPNVVISEAAPSVGVAEVVGVEPASAKATQSVQPQSAQTEQVPATATEPVATPVQQPLNVAQDIPVEAAAVSTKPDDGEVTVQTQPVQAQVTQSPTHSVEEAKPVQTQSESSATAQQQTAPAEAASKMPQASTTTAPQAAAKHQQPASIPTTAEAPTTSVGSADAAVPTSASATAAAVVQPDTVTAGQVQAEQITEQVEPNDRPEVQNTKTEKSTTANRPRAGATVADGASKVPVDTVPVQWRFDGSSQVPKNVTGSAGAAQLIQSMTDPASYSKPVGAESDSAATQTSANQQAAVPMGLQFNAQLRDAQAVAPTSNPDLHVQVIDQVVREVKLSRIDGHSNIVVKLNPPDLGSMRLQITQDAAGITTHIQAASSQVRGLLEAHMPLLMDSLAKAGVQMDAVSVSVGTSLNGFAGSAHQQDAQTNSNQQRQHYSPSGQMGQVGTIADASRPTWGTSEQASHNWLA